ncbi:CPBP family intramembrane glutamic endopeptidase [Piscinibacter terrae]|uniref:CPBP family intramembrane metalloprotease n=1 Tax=Piscinibacter terrae TaxID=2496871 RepID=A0A3N7HYP7_9BURK|nr:CPBP family intramembrane glutamic endopeptidase [Albitalea terrae]RQP26241.1 CPBP family intramembrane metalloprotease [Albitalea terrae]
MSAPEPTTRAPAPLDALAVTILCFGWFILGSIAAVGANYPTGQGFTDSGLASTIVTELVLGGLALVFLRMRGHSVLALLPRPNVAGGMVGVVLYAVGIATWWVTLAMFDTRNMASQPIAEIMANTRVSFTMVLALSLVNGIYEETFLCFLVDAFRGHGASVAIGVSTLVRLLYHVYQGPMGSVSIVLYGVIMAGFYWRTRWLWPVAFAHVLADLVALT